jgi:HEPN domain-containing protein
MAMPKIDAAREWLANAEEDLGLAQGAPTLHTPRLMGGVYHCQQAAEKALKGFLFIHDCPFEKTHDLRDLLGLCWPFDHSFESLQNEAELLNPYAVRYRYPPRRTPLNQEEFDLALAAAERVYRFVLAKHPELDPATPGQSPEKP